jgi:hypothetical protein
MGDSSTVEDNLKPAEVRSGQVYYSAEV